MFCRLQAIGSLIVLRKVFLLALLFCCVYLINMLIETKLAIQDNTQVFLSGRSQYIVIVENERWRQRFFTPLRKIYFCCMLIYVRIKQHFPLILTKSLLMSILLVSMSWIFENSDVSSANILHNDFKPSGKSFIQIENNIG